MTRKLKSTIAGLALIVTSGAANASVTLDLGNTTGQANANALDGPDGNSRVYSATDSGNSFSMRATAWSISAANTITSAFLGAFSGWGLGVTNRNESGYNDTHTIDNSNGYDFVLLQFDKAVTLDRALFNSISGGDTDATLGFGSTNAAWNVSPLWNNQNASVLSSTFSTTFNSFGNATDNWRDINPTDASANVWMISALRPANAYADSFKLEGLKVSVAAVPEASTWAQLLLGLGAIGAIIRASRRRNGAWASNGIAAAA